ncbi:unknown [Bacteroides sp. CAG:770]|nr:unknown [Bacteroides sp. CAG:770]
MDSEVNDEQPWKVLLSSTNLSTGRFSQKLAGIVLRDLQFLNRLTTFVALMADLAVSLNICSGMSTSDSQLVKTWLSIFASFDILK